MNMMNMLKRTMITYDENYEQLEKRDNSDKKQDTKTLKLRQ